MKYLSLFALVLVCELAVAGGGGGGVGRITPAFFNPSQEHEVQFIVRDIVSTGSAGNIVVHAVDHDGKVVLLHVAEDEIVQLEDGNYGVLTRVEGI